MFVSFEELSTESKIWIYLSDTKLDKKHQNFIKSTTTSFLTEWTAHGNSLQASMDLLYDQFLIIAVNESKNEASGCSIDKSVNHMRYLESELGISLLDRSKVALLKNEAISLVDFSQISNSIAAGIIAEDTQVFNNAIITKAELENDWIKPAAKSWIKRYF